MIKGEYWLTEIGEAISADGDAGDWNHEGVVINHVACELLDALGIQHDGEVGGDLDASYHEALVCIPEFKSKGRRGLRDAPAIIALWPNSEQRIEALQVAWSDGDPRLYAVQYLGWVVVKGSNLTVWDMTQAVVDNLADGLSSLADEGEDLSPDDTFSIDVWGGAWEGIRGWFTEVPWRVLQKGNLDYMKRYWMKL